MEAKSYIGSGQIYVREWGSNDPQIEVGNCSQVNLAPQVESKTLPDYTTPGGGLASEVSRNTGVDFSYTFHSFNADNLARAMRGEVTIVPAGTVTDEAHASYEGGFIKLAKIPSGSIVVTDNTATTTYTEGTDYEVRTGGIFILAGTTIPDSVAGANNIKVDYAYAAQKRVQAMVNSAKNYEVTFAGLNEADSGKATVIQMHKVSHGVMSQFAAIGDDFGAGEVTGKLQKDTTKTGTGVSQYYYVDMED